MNTSKDYRKVREAKILAGFPDYPDFYDVVYDSVSTPTTVEELDLFISDLYEEMESIANHILRADIPPSTSDKAAKKLDALRRQSLLYKGFNRSRLKYPPRSEDQQIKVLTRTVYALLDIVLSEFNEEPVAEDTYSVLEAMEDELSQYVVYDPPPTVIVNSLPTKNEKYKTSHDE